MSKADVAAERKSQIVKATVECIAKHGYHNFSMQDVARTAGVSKGIIHYYFLNKDELMMSVLARVAGDIEKMLTAEMAGIDDPARKLEIFIQVCFDVVRSTREYYQVNMDFWTQINQKSDVREVIAKHYASFREQASAVLQAGVDAGAFRDMNVEAYASYIIAVVDGMSLQWLFDDKAFDYNFIVEKMVKIILENIKK